MPLGCLPLSILPKKPPETKTSNGHGQKTVNSSTLENKYFSYMTVTQIKLFIRSLQSMMFDIQKVILPTCVPNALDSSETTK